MAVAFDLDKLEKGLHEVRFRLFIENKFDQEHLDEFQTIDEWKFTSKKIARQLLRKNKIKRKVKTKK